MTRLDPKIEQRCRDSFARQQAMQTIGAASMMVMDTSTGLKD